MKDSINIIISGGGTGGHIFPAVSIANACKKYLKDVNILFVGALGRMEMEKVPAAGYEIVGLPIQGLYRSLTPRNIGVIRNAVRSVRLAKKIIKDFQPDIVIGVGGYASGPVLWQAASMHIPTLIQEQNSYAGVTNKLLSKRARKICVAYDNMQRFFPKKKIVLTGNPVRQQLLQGLNKKKEAYAHFQLDPGKKTLLVIGGSLGARTINESMLKGLSYLTAHANELQIIWQTGKYYYADIQAKTNIYHTRGLIVTDFIARMDLAYSIADLVISRAGASSISELSLLHKPCLLVPSPNVAEDHQTKNAMALVEKDAAVMVADADALFQLVPTAYKLLTDKAKLKSLSDNIAYFAKPEADKTIVSEIAALLGVEMTDGQTEPAAETTEPEAAQAGQTAEAADEAAENLPEETPASKEPAGKYFFLGIGGIGMSALARFLKQNGAVVGGYDRTESELTDSLQAEGMDVHYEDNISRIPVTFMDPEQTTVVYTPAIPDDNKELDFFRKGKFRVIKRAVLLGEITRQYQALCVAGSHGKTTTSGMLACILSQTKQKTNAFLGGICKNFNSNYVTARHAETVVVEADEFDRSFLQLSPKTAVITATDADHLDIYGDRAALLDSFAEFTARIQDGGNLLVKKGIELSPRVGEGVTIYSYSGTETADFYADQVSVGDGTIRFDFVYPQGRIEKVTLGVPVLINVENAVAAMAAAHLQGASDEALRKGIEGFQGTKRRFDVHLKNDRYVLIDDYAHHPNEIAASIASIRALYPGKRICGIFQPHLYSRTKAFAKEFGTSLSALDEVLLLDIYPAREKPMKGVTSNLILKNIKLNHKELCTKNTLLEHLATARFDILLTLGAGDIDQMIPEIKKALEQR
ncbi:MAG: UDP-N-acetylmuramate--L-alanine ligase [Paludibacteraceae bacterium]|nr:UDP-N-acetylmuramate--L-alanine ligase [Paludibacteraceae bacterium]